MTAENLAMTLENDPRWIAGQTFTVSAVATIGSAVETGDSWTATDMLPENKVTLVGGKFTGELDTDASPTATVIVGDGTDTDGYLASKVAGDGTGQLILSFDGALLGAEGAASRDVVVTLGGTVATAATSGDIRVELTYVCSNLEEQT